MYKCLLQWKKIYLSQPFNKLWINQDPFKKIMNLQGTIYRQVKSRTTLRFSCAGQDYFIKIHYGIGWKTFIIQWLCGRRPVCGVKDELNGIQRLHDLGINTLTTVAYGWKGWLANQKSFIITKALTNTMSLEEICKVFSNSWPGFATKMQLIMQIAKISALLHNHGLNHRDYYLCHFLLHTPRGLNGIQPERLKLWLIDLHRLQIRAKTPKRQIIKDLASLWFSAVDAKITMRDYYRFLRTYTGMPLRKTLNDYQWMWQPLNKKVQKMLQRKLKKGDSL